MPDSTTDFTERELAEFERLRYERVLLEGAIRLVECPRCHALPGQDCHTDRWYTSNFHAARIKVVS